MTPNQIAWMLLADPTFAKNAGAMDWLKQKAAPLALAGGMGLAGGVAGSHPAFDPQPQQQQQQQQQAQPALSGVDDVAPQVHENAGNAGLQAERASYMAGRQAEDAAYGAQVGSMGPNDYFGPTIEGFRPEVIRADPNRLHPGDAMYPGPQPGEQPPTAQPPAEASTAEKYPTLAGIPNRVNDFLSGLGEVGGRMAAFPGDVGQALRSGERVDARYGNGTWPYRRVGGSPPDMTPDMTGSSLAEQRKNEANLEMIAAARHRAEAEARKTEAALPTGPEGS